MVSRKGRPCGIAGGVILALLLTTIPAAAQTVATGRNEGSAQSLEQSVRTLAQQVQQLNATISDLRSEVSRSRQETRELRHELEGALDRLALAESAAPRKETIAIVKPQAQGPSAQSAASQSTERPALNERVSKLEESQELLRAKVDDQYQTKVESASKYRLRLSGIALLNAFENSGRVDNQDVPNLALGRGTFDTAGSFGATARQSELGFEVYGPTFAGARTSADLHLDLFGGFPNTTNGVTEGLMRLRTATVRMDWDRTSIVVGQDSPFFSPLSPTSIASLGYPAFSYAGNLWTWTPQARLEHRFDLSNSSGITLQGGFLDPLSGEPPASEIYRTPQAGERSRQPAYASRITWNHGPDDRALSLGLGGYYSRQNYGLGRSMDAWAGTADWSVPMGARLGLTGEFYRGRALGGLGGGTGRSVLFGGLVTDPTSSLTGLNTIGGWTQLKFKATESVEFNAAYGQDNPFSSDLRRFERSYGYAYSRISRNQSEMFNVIYRPRTDLIFSLEYRHINTSETNGDRYTAGHLNLGVGVLF
jgi:regulator of replication initiation timing